jgi:hypothetical protein
MDSRVFVPQDSPDPTAKVTSTNACPVRAPVRGSLDVCRVWGHSPVCASRVGLDRAAGRTLIHARLALIRASMEDLVRIWADRPASRVPVFRVMVDRLVRRLRARTIHVRTKERAT